MTHEHAAGGPARPGREHGLWRPGSRVALDVLAGLRRRRTTSSPSQFFKNAADPDSPLSPFSNESEHGARGRDRLYRDVLSGSDLAPKLRRRTRRSAARPAVAAQMVVVLYWVFDRTPDSERTHRLAERGAG